MNNERMNFSNVCLATIVFLMWLCLPGDSQVKNDTPKPVRPSSCEHITILLDDSIQRVQKLDDAHSTLIVIFRLGRREKNISLNSSRMALIKYSIERRRALERFVLAISPDRSDGLGRAEIYIGGRQIYSLYFGANMKQCEA